MSRADIAARDIDWESIMRAAQRMARRYATSREDSEDIAAAAVEQVWAIAKKRYDPGRSETKWVYAHLYHAVHTAAAIRIYGVTGLSTEECREAFRPWDGMSHAEMVATLVWRYRKKGYSPHGAAAKAQRVAEAIWMARGDGGDHG